VLVALVLDSARDKTKDSITKMSYENQNIDPYFPQPRETIDDLLLRANQEGHTTKEISVWGTDTVVVPYGEVGVAATDKLNGCHVSIFVTPTEGGSAMTMTHFPPGIGRESYREALDTIDSSMRAQGVMPRAIVTLTASDRPAIEDSWVVEHFPDVQVDQLFYKARDPERRANPDAGKCLAILDQSEGRTDLHILTDSGDQSIAL